MAMENAWRHLPAINTRAEEKRSVARGPRLTACFQRTAQTKNREVGNHIVTAFPLGKHVISELRVISARNG